MGIFCEPDSSLLLRRLLLALLLVGQQPVKLVPHQEDAALGPPRIDDPAPLLQILESVVEQEHIERSGRDRSAVAEGAATPPLRKPVIKLSQPILNGVYGDDAEDMSPWGTKMSLT